MLIPIPAPWPQVAPDILGKEAFRGSHDTMIRTDIGDVDPSGAAVMRKAAEAGSAP